MSVCSGMAKRFFFTWAMYGHVWETLVWSLIFLQLNDVYTL